MNSKAYLQGVCMSFVVDENVSKRIISLRFLLIVFVIFIHNNPTEVNFADGTEIYTIPIYVNIIRELISNIIARTAVPLFFLISGFLLYTKETKFIPVLKKRVGQYYYLIFYGTS